MTTPIFVIPFGRVHVSEYPSWDDKLSQISKNVDSWMNYAHDQRCHLVIAKYANKFHVSPLPKHHGLSDLGKVKHVVSGADLRVMMLTVMVL